MQVGQNSRLFGLGATWAVHAGLALAYLFQPVSKAGPPKGEHGLLVFDVPASTTSQSQAAASASTQADKKPLVRIAKSSAVVREPAVASRSSAAETSVVEISSSRSQGASRMTAAVGELRSNYQHILFNHLQHYRYYPEAGRAERMRGQVRVQFALRRDGHILSAWVERSSGILLIDEAALDALRRAEPFPHIPSELPDSIEVLLPLEYLPSDVRAG